MTTSRVAQAQREHHWDSLRALLMLLGIPYHVAMFYRADDIWIVNASDGAPFFTWLSEIIHIFRMQAFFIIAGYFAALLLARRSPAEWLKGRFIRLGIPFVACLVTLNPLLNLICELSNYPLRPALTSWEYNSVTSGGYWVRHLWFIIVLLYCSTVAALLCACAPGIGQARTPARRDDWLARNLMITLLGAGIVIGLWEAVAIELFYKAGLATNGPQQILRLDQLIEFVPWFMAGWLVARSPRFKDALHKPSLPIALIGIGATMLHLALAGQLHPAVGRFIDTIAAITLTQVLLASFKRLADRPHPAVQELVRASFVIYLVHLPIAAGLVLLGQHMALPLTAKALLIVALTLALSWGAWRVVLASPLLRLLYDGILPPSARAPATSDLRRQSL